MNKKPDELQKRKTFFENRSFQQRGERRSLLENAT